MAASANGTAANVSLTMVIRVRLESVDDRGT